MSRRRTRFADAMDQKGIKVDEISIKSGYSQGYIYKLRRGDQQPSLKAAKILSDLIGEPITIFVSDDSRDRTVKAG